MDSKVSAKNKKAPVIFCPRCGSQHTSKVHRTVFEKLISYFTFGKFAYRKYYCKLCDRYVYKSRIEASNDEKFPEQALQMLDDEG